MNVIPRYSIIVSMLLFAFNLSAAAGLRVNEFVADNSPTGQLDQDSDSSDWIEIYNPGPGVADLTNYFLTDNAEVPNKWALPSMTIPEDGFLIVFASGKDRALAGSELHTNFKLAAQGEYLALTKEDDNVGFETISEFATTFPEQRHGVSYGYGKDGDDVGYFDKPTPGAANGKRFNGFVADIEFDVARGLFTEPITISFSSATPDVEIRYTTNGSAPTIFGSKKYSEPITISETTMIRAVASSKDLIPTKLTTQTYLFPQDIVTQNADGMPPNGWPTSVNRRMDYGMDPDITSRYTEQEMMDALIAIPSVALSFDQKDFTGSKGVYVNSDKRGREWERPVSVEIIHPDGVTQNVQIDCGIRIRGGASRRNSNPKHAFRLFFRREYGADTLNSPLFGSEGVDRFEKLDLRTAQGYAWSGHPSGQNHQNTFLREVLARDLQGNLGQPYTRSRYYHLYINGIYWGLYMSHERPEAHFGASYLEGSRSEFDVLKSASNGGGYNTETTDGSMEPGSDWETLWQLTRDQEADPSIERFMRMQGLGQGGVRNPEFPVLLDVDNLIDYMLVVGYTGSYDGPLNDFGSQFNTNNWYSIRNAERDERGFIHIVHDFENSLGADPVSPKWERANNRMNTKNGATGRARYNKSNPQFIHFDLAEGTEEYRLRFADRAHRALFNDGVLTPAEVLATLEKRRTIVENVIIAESARWGDAQQSEPRDKEDWDGAVADLVELILGRTQVFLGHLRLADLYPDLEAPCYFPHGGLIGSDTSVESIVPTAGTHLYYMIGSDDDANAGEWSDALDPRQLGGAPHLAASSIPITAITGDDVKGQTLTIPDKITSPVWIKSRTYDETSGEWSALNQAFFTTARAATQDDLVISEVHYHPLAPTDSEKLIDPNFDQDDFEFVKLKNIASETVDLGGVAFASIPIGDHLEGIKHTFALGTLLEAGQELVVAANRTAFAARYPGVPIAGDYTNRLDNNGEWLSLVTRAGDVIDSFRYNDADPWPQTADGEGHSLVRNAPDTDSDPSLAESWSASTTVGGSPASDMNVGNPFTGDPLADVDRDGVAAILEYALGLSDSEPSTEALLSYRQVTIDGIHYAGFSFRRDPAATDVDFTVEVTENLETWIDAEAEGQLALVETEPDPDGVPRLTYRFLTPLTESQSQYVRLHVEGR